MQNYSYEDEFDLLESEPVGGQNTFHMNGFACRLMF